MFEKFGSTMLLAWPGPIREQLFVRQYIPELDRLTFLKQGLKRSVKSSWQQILLAEIAGPKQAKHSSVGIAHIGPVQQPGL